MRLRMGAAPDTPCGYQARRRPAAPLHEAERALHRAAVVQRLVRRRQASRRRTDRRAPAPSPRSAAAWPLRGAAPQAEWDVATGSAAAGRLVEQGPLCVARAVREERGRRAARLGDVEEEQATAACSKFAVVQRGRLEEIAVAVTVVATPFDGRSASRRNFALSSGAAELGEDTAARGRATARATLALLTVSAAGRAGRLPTPARFSRRRCPPPTHHCLLAIFAAPRRAPDGRPGPRWRCAQSADAADADRRRGVEGKEKSKGWGRINPFARKKEADDAEAKAKAEEAKKKAAESRARRRSSSGRRRRSGTSGRRRSSGGGRRCCRRTSTTRRASSGCGCARSRSTTSRARRSPASSSASPSAATTRRSRCPGNWSSAGAPTSRCGRRRSRSSRWACRRTSRTAAAASRSLGRSSRSTGSARTRSTRCRTSRSRCARSRCSARRRWASSRCRVMSSRRARSSRSTR